MRRVVACLSKHRRQHGWTCRPHGNAVFCSFEQSDVGSLPIIETQKSSHWNEKRRHCLDPGLSDRARCAHLPGDEVKLHCLFLRKPFRAQKSVSQVFFHCTSMQRSVSMRSSSSVDLDYSSLDDVRTERAAIALSVGLSSPPVRRRRSAGHPSWKQLWDGALQEHILHHLERPRGVRLQRPDWWRPGGAIARPPTHEDIAHVSTLCAPPHPLQPLHSVKTSPAAAQQNTTKSTSTPSCWFLDMLDHWRTERQWGTPQCLGEVRRPVPRDVRRDQPEHSLPLETELASRSAARQEDFAVTRRHDTAVRAHPASDRRPVPQRGDRRRGARQPSPL